MFLALEGNPIPADQKALQDYYIIFDHPQVDDTRIPVRINDSNLPN